MNIEKIMIQVVVDSVNDLIQQRKWKKVVLSEFLHVHCIDCLIQENKKKLI